MRKNELISLDQFKSQYCGIWAPSDEHWYGLDFSWNHNEYRLHTGLMYSDEHDILPDGRTVLFGLYKREKGCTPEYRLIGQFAAMDELLTSRCIGGQLFSEIIMADDTELLGQD